MIIAACLTNMWGVAKECLKVDHYMCECVLGVKDVHYSAGEITITYLIDCISHNLNFV